MITKIIKGNGFKGLSSYITREDATARVIGADNLTSADPRQAARMMRQTANLSTRCKKPVLHFSLRAAPGDRVLTDEEWLQAGRTMLDAFGMSGHQALFVTHEAGTPGQHLHVMSNRIDPTTGKAAALNNDRRIAKKVAAQIEKDFALLVAVQERPPQKADRDTQPERRERARKGRTSTDRHKEAAKAAFARSGASQADFKAILAEHGFALARGDRRGVVIVDRSGRSCSFSRALTKDQRDRLAVDRAGLQAVPAARLQLVQAAQNRRKTGEKILSPRTADLTKPRTAPPKRKRNENVNDLQTKQQIRAGVRRARGLMRAAERITRGLEID